MKIQHHGWVCSRTTQHTVISLTWLNIYSRRLELIPAYSIIHYNWVVYSTVQHSIVQYSNANDIAWWSTQNILFYQGSCHVIIYLLFSSPLFSSLLFSHMVMRFGITVLYCIVSRRQDRTCTVQYPLASSTFFLCTVQTSLACIIQHSTVLYIALRYTGVHPSI